MFIFFFKRSHQTKISTESSHNQKAAHPEAAVFVDPDPVAEGRFLCKSQQAAMNILFTLKTQIEAIHLVYHMSVKREKKTAANLVYLEMTRKGMLCQGRNLSTT